MIVRRYFTNFGYFLSFFELVLCFTFHIVVVVVDSVFLYDL